MGNCLSSKKSIGPTAGDLNEDENREVKSVVTRRATKGKGLLGKTNWSDEEDEDDDENGEAGGEEAGEEEIGALPNIDQGTGDDIVIQAKNQRVTLMAKPQMPIVSNEDSDPCKISVIYISNISQDDVEPKLDQIERACFNTPDDIAIEKDSRICIYSGQLYSAHNALDIDAAITSGEVPDDVDKFPVLSRRTGCQLITQKLNEKIGLLALDDIDEAGKWLEHAKNEANKMLKHDQPDIIIAICHCGLTQAKKMAACNISGIKCILCADPVLPTDETTELGTVIVSLNQKANQGAQIEINFDNFHQPEFGPTSFFNLFT
jgi:ribose 5-phosphate isomerase RpiB